MRFSLILACVGCRINCKNHSKVYSTWMIQNFYSYSHFCATKINLDKLLRIQLIRYFIQIAQFYASFPHNLTLLKSISYVIYSEYLRHNLDLRRLLASYQNTKFTTTTKESMVLINHNDVYLSRKAELPGKNCIMQIVRFMTKCASFSTVFIYICI